MEDLLKDFSDGSLVRWNHHKSQTVRAMNTGGVNFGIIIKLDKLEEVSTYRNEVFRNRWKIFWNIYRRSWDDVSEYCITQYIDNKNLIIVRR